MLMLNNNRGSVEGLGQSGRGGVVKGQQVPSCRQHKYKYKYKYKSKYKHSLIYPCSYFNLPYKFCRSIDKDKVFVKLHSLPSFCVRIFALWRLSGVRCPAFPRFSPLFTPQNPPFWGFPPETPRTTFTSKLCSTFAY